jgi:hypothetical protein
LEPSGHDPPEAVEVGVAVVVGGVGETGGGEVLVGAGEPLGSDVWVTVEKIVSVVVGPCTVFVTGTVTVAVLPTDSVTVTGGGSGHDRVTPSLVHSTDCDDPAADAVTAHPTTASAATAPMTTARRPSIRTPTGSGPRGRR